MSVLKGKRLNLRPIERADLEKLNEWKNDESVYRFLGGGYMPVSIDIQEKWMESMMDTTGNNKRFMIVDTHGKSIGLIGLYDINWIHRTFELGIFIGETGEQGKGYGAEAYSLIEHFAIQYLNLRKVKVNVVKDNLKAVKMYDKLGFKKAGELVAERFVDGKYRSVLLMEKIFEG